MLSGHIGLPKLSDLAARSTQVSDVVSLRSMNRLGGLLHETADVKKELAVVANFGISAEGFPAVDCAVSGSAELNCQRCLGALSWPVDLQFQLTVVTSEEDLKKLADPFDAVMADDQGLDLIVVIEDELLGSLPLAPMHTGAHECNVQEQVGGIVVDKKTSRDVPDGTDHATEHNRPFAGLSAIMRTGSDSEGTDKT